MSSPKGSRLFANDKKTVIKLLTMALLSVGIIAASLFAFQQFTRPVTPNLISKDKAVQVAIAAMDWNDQTLKDKKADATLLHVRQNGFSFVVDQNTLQDTLTLSGDPLPQHENQYLWKIEFAGSGNTVNGYWVAIINAENGEILMHG